MSRAEGGRLSPVQALVLGALHGPAELLPISSSAHVEMLPWLLGWSYDSLDGEVRKAFEVALHAGTVLALVVGRRREVAEAFRDLPRDRVALLALSAAAPAAAGFLLERPIEQRLGTPASAAAGLVAGSALLALAAGAPQSRRWEAAGAEDGLWLGLAQSAALVPGVSRTGATFAVARLRRFHAADAGRLSRLVGLPVIGGAAGLKAVRMRQRPPPAGQAAAFAVGATAAFLSALACVGHGEQREQSVWPYVIYRIGLAAAIARRLARS